MSDPTELSPGAELVKRVVSLAAKWNADSVALSSADAAWATIHAAELLALLPTAGDEGGEAVCRCGHIRLQHIYEEGACRPGFACPDECTEFAAPTPPVEGARPERQSPIPDVTASGGVLSKMTVRTNVTRASSAREASFAPVVEGARPEGEAWIDKHGDVWRLGNDGLLWPEETAPFPREHVEKKWGPLRPAPDGARPEVCCFRIAVEGEHSSDCANYMRTALILPEDHPEGAEEGAWPCDNYTAPLTCLTAPSTETGRCDQCRDRAEEGAAGEVEGYLIHPDRPAPVPWYWNEDTRAAHVAAAVRAAEVRALNEAADEMHRKFPLSPSGWLRDRARATEAGVER